MSTHDNSATKNPGRYGMMKDAIVTAIKSAIYQYWIPRRMRQGEGLSPIFGDPECLHGDTLVNFVNGRSLPIRYVVENKILGDVWAFDEEAGKMVAAPIVSHHFNGIAKNGELLTVTSEALDTRNGVLSATVSVTHGFLTKDGWKTAKELAAGDELVTRYRSQINGTVRQFLLGTACGDITLAVTHAYGKSHKACLKIGNRSRTPFDFAGLFLESMSI